MGNRKIENIDFILVRKLAAENKSIEGIALEINITVGTLYNWLQKIDSNTYPNSQKEYYELLSKAFYGGRKEYINNKKNKLNK